MSAIFAPLSWGAAIVLLARTAGLQGRTFEHLSGKLPWTPLIVLAAASGAWTGKTYVSAYEAADAEAEAARASDL